jgi:hypothetical protein
MLLFDLFYGLLDMVMSDSDLELSCDSGIEAEMYDSHGEKEMKI